LSNGQGLKQVVCQLNKRLAQGKKFESCLLEGQARIQSFSSPDCYVPSSLLKKVVTTAFGNSKGKRGLESQNFIA